MSTHRKWKMIGKFKTRKAANTKKKTYKKGTFKIEKDVVPNSYRLYRKY